MIEEDQEFYKDKVQHIDGYIEGPIPLSDGDISILFMEAMTLACKEYDAAKLKGHERMRFRSLLSWALSCVPEDKLREIHFLLKFSERT